MARSELVFVLDLSGTCRAIDTCSFGPVADVIAPNFPPTTRRMLTCTDHPLDLAGRWKMSLCYRPDLATRRVVGFRSSVAVTALVVLLPLNGFTSPPAASAVCVCSSLDSGLRRYPPYSGLATPAS